MGPRCRSPRSGGWCSLVPRRLRRAALDADVRPRRAGPCLARGRRSPRGVILALLGAARLPGLLRPARRGARRGRRPGARAARGRGGRRGAAARALGLPPRPDRARGGGAARASTCPTAASTRRRCSRWGSAGPCWRSAAAVLAFWPRSGGRTGFRPLALLAARDALRGARRSCSTSRASSSAAPCSPCSCSPSCGSSACPWATSRRRGSPRASRPLAALLAAPLLDGREPWWDYEALGGRHRGGARGRLQLGARLLAAGLAARRARDAAGQGAPGGVLEGPGPRPVRRQHLAGRSAGARRGGDRAAAGEPGLAPDVVPGDRGHAAQPALQHVRRGGRRDGGARRRRATRWAAASSPRRTGSGRATRTRPTSTRRGRPSASCAPRRPTTRTRCAGTSPSIVPPNPSTDFPALVDDLARLRRPGGRPWRCGSTTCRSSRRSSAPG